jgi:hypothetical protein
MIRTAKVFGLGGFLAATLLASHRQDQVPGAFTKDSELVVDGVAVTSPVFAVSGSSNLLIDQGSHRIVQLDLVRRTGRRTTYPAIPLTSSPVDAYLVRNQVIAILDNSANPGILEFSPSGSVGRIPISEISGPFFSFAPWQEGTYLVAPASTAELIYHISRQGKILTAFGKSPYFSSPGAFRLSNHCRVYAGADFSAVYAVDTLAGIITVWNTQFKSIRSISLPRHPHAPEINDFIGEHLGRPPARLFTVEIYGNPVMAAHLLIFPGISFSAAGEPVRKTLFALETSTGRLTTYKPILGIGGQIVSDGRLGVLLDATLGRPVEFHFFTLER